jgi:glycosyltransferase involved in cell wall biosynthesis
MAQVSIHMHPICFIANDREFLFRHFAPAISAAKARKSEVIVYLPGEVRGAETQFDGVKIISSPTVRRHSSPLALISEGLWFARALRKVDPAIVVAYSLRMCCVLALAHVFLLSSRFVFVVTGVGFFGIAESIRARMVRSIIFMAIRHVSRRRSYFLFENNSDPVTTGVARRGYRFSILMGAGVDLREFSQRDIPEGLPLRFATTSRLVWSKGIDLAVAAISTLASQGYAVELHIYGVPDLANPRPVDPENFRNIPGVHYRGFSSRVADLWGDYHAAIFTSRGGEGLPRALLEAAASGRACIVTAVPGCADLIRDNVEGYVVPPGSDHCLREAILKLLAAPDKLSGFGQRAHDRVRATSTAEIVQARYDEIFRWLREEHVQALSSRATRTGPAEVTMPPSRRSTP